MPSLLPALLTLIQGFFQEFYTDVQLSKSSSTTISLIGALQICLVYAGGPITGKLFDAHGLSVG